MSQIFDLLTPSQQAKALKFFAEQDAVALEDEKEQFKDGAPIEMKLAWADGQPYSGAIGGSRTYIFTPTSLGVIVIVRHGITNAELNITNFEDW